MSWLYNALASHGPRWRRYSPGSHRRQCGANVTLNIHEQSLTIRALGGTTPFIASGQVLTEIEDAAVSGKTTEELVLQFAVLIQD